MIFGAALVDHLMVHVCGFLLDLTICFFLYFDYTRPSGLFFGAAFHVMNSHLFSIGMFPYTMLATMPIFCYPDWPRSIFSKTMELIRNVIGRSSSERDAFCFKTKLEQNNYSANLLLAKENKTFRQHAHCLYLHSPKTTKGSSKSSRPKKYHHLACLYLVTYVAIQSYLPFSHHLTQGGGWSHDTSLHSCLEELVSYLWKNMLCYNHPDEIATQGFNHWKDGLYGYSWDMMIHSSASLYRRVYVHFVHNNTRILSEHHKYLVTRNRWVDYGRLGIQYAKCLEKHLKTIDSNVKNIEIYYDIWTSLNERILQRFFHPKVNILKAEWSLFKPTWWVLPLLNDSDVWRNKADEVSELYNATHGVLGTFVTDFPGMTLENCIQHDLENATVEILEGEAILEINGLPNVTLKVGTIGNLTSGKMYKLHATSSKPTTYFFVATNTTVKNMAENITVNSNHSLTEEEEREREECSKYGMLYEFAYEGDVDREKAEYKALVHNTTYFNSIYQGIQSLMANALYKRKSCAVKNAVRGIRTVLLPSGKCLNYGTFYSLI